MLGQKLKLFKNYFFTIWGMIKVIFFKKNLPLAISFSLTDHCKNNCSYCSIPARGLSGLPLKSVKRVLNRLYQLGTRRIVFTGGEPFCRWDLGSILHHAKKKGFFVSLNTSGHDIFRHSSALSQVDMIFISLDGKRENHDRIRGKGQFDQAVSAALYAKKQGCSVIVTMVLSKDNVDDIKFLANFAKGKGFCVDFEFYSPHALSGPSKIHELDCQDINKIIKKITILRKKGYPILISPGAIKDMARSRGLEVDKGEKNVDNPLLFPGKNILGNKKYCDKAIRNCFAGRGFAFIDTDGTAWPCFDMRKKGRGIRLEKWLESGRFPKAPRACHHCYCNGAFEINRLFSLDPQSILNILRWI